MNHDDHDMPDELMSQSEGKAVSATYREASTETPPPALDALILGKARAALGQNASKRHSSWRAVYQLAASFVLGILISALYYNAPADLMPVQKSVLPSAVSTAEPTAVPAPAADSTFRSEAPATAAAVNADQQRMMDVNASAGGQTASFSQSTRPAVDTENVNGQTSVGLRTAFGDQAGQQALQQVTSLSEVVVTGLRIQAPERATAPYRSSREQWREEIAQLVSAVNAATVDLQALSARLAEEQALFLQAFPDSPIDGLSDGQSAAQGD